MTFSEKLAVLENVEQLMYEGRFNDLGALVHPDFVVHEDFGMPYGGCYQGSDGFSKLVANVVGAWDGLKTKNLSALDEPGGDGVLMIVELSGRSRATGEAVEALTSEFWRVRDGKLAEGRVWYFDTPSVAAKLTGTALSIGDKK